FMEQMSLHQFERKLFPKFVVELRSPTNTLENEKEKFLRHLCEFIDEFDFKAEQVNGRPLSNLRDVLKGLLIMSYHGMSYRRCQSDIRRMQIEGLIENVHGRSTLNDYANSSEITK